MRRNADGRLAAGPQCHLAPRAAVPVRRARGWR
jgi:hypothetical protein